MSQFVAEWLHMERSNHARLLYQLKRELVDARRVAAAPTSSLPRTHETDRAPASDRSSMSDHRNHQRSDRPSVSDPLSTNDRSSDRSGERPITRPASSVRSVMVQ